MHADRKHVRLGKDHSARNLQASSFAEQDKALVLPEDPSPQGQADRRSERVYANLWTRGSNFGALAKANKPPKTRKTSAKPSTTASSMINMLFKM